ncbi:hypothetical protein BOX15_Mlig027170g1, partial [Macrostomum lignano]
PHDRPSRPLSRPVVASGLSRPTASPAGHVKRPMNPFMVWAKLRRKAIAKENPKMHNSEISRKLGEEWKTMRDDEKKGYIDEANRLKDEHKRANPGYKYKPKSKKRAAGAASTGAAAPAGQQQKPQQKSKTQQKQKQQSMTPEDHLSVQHSSSSCTTPIQTITMQPSRGTQPTSSC